MTLVVDITVLVMESGGTGGATLIAIHVVKIHVTTVTTERLVLESATVS